MNSAIECLIRFTFTAFAIRRDGRVVDYSSLENCRTERYRGFESLSLRFRYSEMNIREKPKKNVSIIATSSYDTFLLYPS